MCRQLRPPMVCSCRFLTATVVPPSRSNLSNSHNSHPSWFLHQRGILPSLVGEPDAKIRVNMKQRILFCVLILCGFLVLASGRLRAQSAVTIALSPNNPGAAIPED